MKYPNKILLTFHLNISFLYLISCASLKESQFKSNPEFAAQANKFSIACPIPKLSSKSHHYTFENEQTNTIYKSNVTIHFPGSQSIDSDDLSKGEILNSKEFAGYRLYISNSIDSSEFEVLGTTDLSRTTEKQSKSLSEETVILHYPIEFWIFQNGKDVGMVKIHTPLSTQIMNFILYERHFELEVQKQFNKSYFSIKTENQLIALVELQPKAFISTKLKGKAFIQSESSGDVTPDILTIFIIADIISNIIDEMM